MLLFRINLIWTPSLLILALGIRPLSNSGALAISRKGDPVRTDGDADLRAGAPESLEETLSGESDRRRMFKPVGESELR